MVCCQSGNLVSQTHMGPQVGTLPEVSWIYIPSSSPGLFPLVSTVTSTAGDEARATTGGVRARSGQNVFARGAFQLLRRNFYSTAVCWLCTQSVDDIVGIQCVFHHIISVAYLGQWLIGIVYSFGPSTSTYGSAAYSMSMSFESQARFTLYPWHISRPLVVGGLFIRLIERTYMFVDRQFWRDV